MLSLNFSYYLQAGDTVADKSEGEVLEIRSFRIGGRHCRISVNSFNQPRHGPIGDAIYLLVFCGFNFCHFEFNQSTADQKILKFDKAIRFAIMLKFRRYYCLPGA